MHTPTLPSLAQALRDGLAQGLDRVDAQMLLLHAVGQPTHARAWLIAHDDDRLTTEQATHWQQLVMQRLAGVPVAYLTGHKAFYGLDLRVDARVLDPRPDTETLVDWALEICRAGFQTRPAMVDGRAGLKPASTERPDESQDEGSSGRVAQIPAIHPSAPTSASAQTIAVLDLGTGSGAIALAIAHAAPQVRVTAVDASADALAVARANAKRLGLHVAMHQGNWFAALPVASTQASHATGATATAQVPGTRFALIVSNPPYIRDGDAHLPALMHEPRQALTSGPDGLDDIRRIVAEAPAWLVPGGWLLLEHGWDQGEAVRALLGQSGFVDVQSRTDLAGQTRCTGGRWP